MTIVANTFAYVIGADTHSRTHTLAVLDARTGARVDTRTFPTTPAGLSRAVAWIARRTSGLADVLVTIEGVGSYGARLARACQDAGYRVVESFPTAARERRGRGKSDEIDAELIARSVLGVDADNLRDPRQALRVLIGARDLINLERTRSINALTALLRTVDLGIDARASLTKKQLAAIESWRTRQEDLATATARREAIRLARRVAVCDEDLAANRDEITALVARQRRRNPARRARDRRDQRGRDHRRLVTPRPGPLRSSVRRARRRQSRARLERKHHPSSPQPRRRQASEQSLIVDRADPNVAPPADPRLRRTPTSRRTHHQGNPPLTQAIHSPPALPPPQRAERT